MLRKFYAMLQHNAYKIERRKKVKNVNKIHKPTMQKRKKFVKQTFNSLVIKALNINVVVV